MINAYIELWMSVTIDYYDEFCNLLLFFLCITNIIFVFFCRSFPPGLNAMHTMQNIGIWYNVPQTQ